MIFGFSDSKTVLQSPKIPFCVQSSRLPLLTLFHTDAIIKSSAVGRHRLISGQLQTIWLRYCTVDCMGYELYQQCKMFLYGGKRLLAWVPSNFSQRDSACVQNGRVLSLRVVVRDPGVTDFRHLCDVTASEQAGDTSSVR